MRHPTMTGLFSDSLFRCLSQVPNIRFNVAKELYDIAKVCGPTLYEQQIKPVLSLLQDDLDRDVRFFAEKTSKILEEEFSRNVKN
jgi:hypothetical protein